MELTALKTVWRSALVRRWHANPDLTHTTDFLLGHGGRVVLILHHLMPNVSRNVILAALFHDLGEIATGDVPAITKKEHPDLAKMLENIERSKRLDIGVEIHISEGEKRLIKFADRIDAYFWAQHHAPHSVEKIDFTYSRNWIDGEAVRLGFAPKLGFLDGYEPSYFKVDVRPPKFSTDSGDEE